jgi:hypothetical protein
MTKAWDFKFSRNHSLHSLYDWGGILEYIFVQLRDRLGFWYHLVVQVIAFLLSRVCTLYISPCESDQYNTQNTGSIISTNQHFVGVWDYCTIFFLKNMFDLQVEIILQAILKLPSWGSIWSSIWAHILHSFNLSRCYSYHILSYGRPPHSWRKWHDPRSPLAPPNVSQDQLGNPKRKVWWAQQYVFPQYETKV